MLLAIERSFAKEAKSGISVVIVVSVTGPLLGMAAIPLRRAQRDAGSKNFPRSPRWGMSQATFAAIVKSQASSSEPMSDKNLNNNEITDLVNTSSCE